MKTISTIMFCSALALFGCKKGAAGGGDCAAAINKGVDTMMAAGAKRLEGAPPEMKTKMEEASVKLKGVITNRCTEDKWSADVVDCYAAAQKREDLRACRAKLPAEQAAKLQKEEMEVMMGAGFGGMRPHGAPGTGEMAPPPPMTAPAPAPAGSAAAPKN